MSTGAIIAIVVVILLILALVYFLVLSPKKRQERALKTERDQAATHHREVAQRQEHQASLQQQRAEEAKLQAEKAEQEAHMARREAEVNQSRAELHEQGLADHELDHGPDEPAAGDHDGDGRSLRDRLPGGGDNSDNGRTEGTPVGHDARTADQRTGETLREEPREGVRDVRDTRGNVTGRAHEPQPEPPADGSRRV